MVELMLAVAWSFSVPEAPYSIDREAKGGVKATPVVTDKEIRVGSRKVKVQGSMLDVLVNGMSALTVSSRIECNSGWDSVAWWNLTVDKDGKGVHRTYTHPAARTKDGKDCRFESSVRALPNGEIELTVFNPGPEPKRGCRNFNMTMPVALWHDQWVSINGSQPFRVPATAHEWELTPFPKDTKMTMHLYPAGSSFAFFQPDGKTKRFGFRLGENARGGCIQRGSDKQVYMNFCFDDPAKPAKFYVDLGDVRVSREKPHLVGGVDFREENDFDVACWDEKANVLVNGGFESGARYYRFESGYEVTNAAHSGQCALRPLGQSYSVGVVLKPNTWYTFSGWIRSLTGQHVGMGVQARGTNGYPGFLDRMMLETDRKNPNEWHRCQKSFRTKEYTSEVTVWFESSSWGKFLIDDLCFAEGSNAVATAVNPWGLELRTGAEDNLFVPADRKNGKIQLLVRGPKGAKAKLDISGGDLLARRTIAKKANVTIPASGETLVDLGPDSAFPKGVNGIKVRVQPLAERAAPLQTAVGARLAPRVAYTDYLRFNKAKWGDNRQKHRYFQLTPGGGGFVGTLARNPELYERKLRRNVMLGMGGLSYTQTWAGPEYFTDAERALLDKYGVRDFWGAVRANTGWKHWLNGKPWEWQGTNINALVTYPADLLKWVEDEMCAYAEKIPWRTFWSIDSEPAGKFASLRAGRLDEYAKLLAAINRGLKRANPKNEFCPYGTWNMGGGTAEIAAMLRLLRVVDPETHYKYIEVHSYREFPEDPDVQKDLDTFYQRLSGAGYDDMQIKIGEGSYYFPMFRPSRDMYPWSGVAGHDGYSGVVIPGYDLGYGEKIGAALTTRETAIYYKNDKRVFCNCSWNPRWIDQDSPCGWLLANTALLEMLGDATYLGEVRFAPKSRAMFFDDGHGALTVFMWRGDATFDKGQTGPVEAEIDFGDIQPEFYDLYANRCVPARGASGSPTDSECRGTARTALVPASQLADARRIPVSRNSTIIPLSGYPVYIKLPKEQVGRAKEFKRAITETLVKADLNKLPLSCSLTLKDAATVEVKVVNTLSRTVKAQVKVNGEDKGEMTVGGLKDATFTVKLEKPIAAEAYTPVKVLVEFVYEGKTFVETFETSAVAVGYVKGDQPDWTTVPAVDLFNFAMWHNVGPHKSKKDFNGTVQLAWNEKHLWMKFKANDDILMLPKDKENWKAWGSDSDMIWLYFDGYANGREKFRRGQEGYDFDDFQFGVYPLSKSLAKVVRMRAPDHQLTGGAGYGFVVGPEDHVKTEFAADGQGYELTLDFPAYYMMPVKLEAGGISPGFAAVVYDRDQNDYPPRKSVSNLTGTSDAHPENWPQLIFVK